MWTTCRRVHAKRPPAVRTRTPQGNFGGVDKHAKAPIRGSALPAFRKEQTWGPSRRDDQSAILAHQGAAQAARLQRKEALRAAKKKKAKPQNIHYASITTAHSQCKRAEEGASAATAEQPDAVYGRGKRESAHAAHAGARTVQYARQATG